MIVVGISPRPVMTNIDDVPFLGVPNDGSTPARALSLYVRFTSGRLLFSPSDNMSAVAVE
jgi:hypothetical protein